MTEPADDSLGAGLYRVAVRLPPFWPDRPALWFAQAEAQFDLAGITRQRTKFNHVVSQLHQQHAAEVEDIITSPPEHESYDRLKAELVRIQRYLVDTGSDPCVFPRKLLPGRRKRTDYTI